MLRTNQTQVRNILDSYAQALDALAELQLSREELIARSGPRIANNDGLPRSGNIGDPTHQAALRLEKIDARIEAAAERAEELYNLIDGWIYQLLIDGGKRGRNMSLAIKLRYIQRLSPGDCAFEIFGNAEDFDEREASFVRRTFRLIDEASEKISKFEEKERKVNDFKTQKPNDGD